MKINNEVVEKIKEIIEKRLKNVDEDILKLNWEYAKKNTTKSPKIFFLSNFNSCYFDARKSLGLNVYDPKINASHIDTALKKAVLGIPKFQFLKEEL